MSAVITPAPSALTLGTSGLGRDTEVGSVEEATAVDLVLALLRSDHALLDTSNAYAGGRSEAVIGKALAALGPDEVSSAGQPPVVTKVDCDPETGVFDRDRVLRSYEESLARLGVDRVSLVHLHDPFTITFEQAVAPGGALDGMRHLRDTGAVDAIGIAAAPASLVQQYVDTGAFDAVLCHNRFTLVDQTARALFEDAKSRGMTVFNAAPFGAGLLAKGSASGARYGYREVPDDLRRWVQAAEEVCASNGVSLRAAALHFSLRSPLVDSTVVGVSSASRLAELDELAATPVPDDVWGALEDLGPAPSNVDA